METFAKTFGDLVRDRLAELKLNAFSAENAAGLPPDAIRNVLRSEKQAGPTLARAKEICDALGLDIRIEPKSAVGRSYSQNMTGDDDAPVGFVTIPWHGAAPGDGSAPVAFARAWLDRQQLKPDFLQAVMPDRFLLPDAPAPGTVALLDTRLSPRAGAALWCFRDAGRVTLARITFKGDLAAIHPAHTDQETRLLDQASAANLGLIGRVVWLGQLVPMKGRVD